MNDHPAEIITMTDRRINIKAPDQKAASIKTLDQKAVNFKTHDQRVASISTKALKLAQSRNPDLQVVRSNILGTRLPKMRGLLLRTVLLVDRNALPVV